MQYMVIDNIRDILTLFHHIHHQDDKHIVHHCGVSHIKQNPKLDYTIKHCSCGKHRIDKESAIGHDFALNEVRVKFTEKCPEGGWHLESGELFKIY